MRKNFRLTPQQASDARAALTLLDGSGLSITDAARMALGGGNRADIDPISVQDAIDRFLVRCLRRVEQKTMRQSTYLFYEDALSLFALHYADRQMGSFTRAELCSHFESLQVSPSRAAGRYRAVRALFRYGAKQEPRWFRDDPTMGLELDLEPVSKTIHFLAIEETESIMAKCRKYRAALALVLFAGVRIEEVAGKGKPWLQWQHVDIEARQIRIPPEIAKTGRARIQEELPENLWQWLEAAVPAKKHGAISPSSAHSISVAAKTALGGQWKQNSHRHSFATYHLAAFGHPGRLSILLGHEGDLGLLYNSYRGLATKSEGMEYFKITP